MECDHRGWASTTLSEEEEREKGAKVGFSKPLQTLSGLNYCTCWALKTTRHRDVHTTAEADVISQYEALLHTWTFECTKETNLKQPVHTLSPISFLTTHPDIDVIQFLCESVADGWADELKVSLDMISLANS